MGNIELPNHIVLIPDGNRRWARKKGLPSFFGHRQGAKVIEKILKTSLEMEINNITFWGSSSDNITKRSEREVNLLLNIFKNQFKKLSATKEIHRQQVKINVLGRWKELFPKNVKEVINKVIEETRNYKNHQLTFLMAYSGIDEMTETIRKIAVLKDKNPRIKIDGNLIKKNLWTKDLPSVDLVIRTGGEPHWSAGLMMWDMANSYLYFTKTLFPDFSVKEFKKTINQYSKTEKRMGE